MKKFYIILIALFVVSGASAQWGSSCLPEDIIFSTQAQIDSFQVNYPGYTEIEGNVNISGDGITNLNGLDVLTSIGGGLGIGPNVTLTSLTGLDNIDAGSINDLYISYNTLLSACAVQSICDYLASPNSSFTIEYNAIGCKSAQQVLAACEVGLDESAVSGRQSAVNIYPNPSSTTITISTPTTPNKNTILTITSLSGQQLIRRQITEQQTVVDVSGLPQGFM